MQRPDYFIRAAYRGLTNNLLVSLPSILTVTVSLLTLSSFVLLYQNLRASAATWGRSVQIVAYLSEGISTEEVNSLSDMISRMAGVSAVKYVSQDDALDRFRRDLEGQAGILEGLSKNPLPASFEIQLREGGADSERVASVAEKVGELAGIDEVQYGQEWLSQYATAINLLRIAGVVIGTFLLIGCMLVVANTIKLAVYARREELEILSLVGATKRFIRLPFLIEGMAQGFLGALLAVVILYGGYRILLSRIDASLLLNVGRFELIFLSTPALLSLLGIGTIVGFCGSAISVRRFGRS